MITTIPRIKQPELFFGFVSPIGADIRSSLKSFGKFFEEQGYNVVEIKVTDLFPLLENYITPDNPLQKAPLYERYMTYIGYGNQLRRTFEDDAVLAAGAIWRIVRSRVRQKRGPEDLFSKTVYLIHQFKRKEEIDVLRSVYGRLFFQISVYSRRGSRVDYLSRKFTSSVNSSGPMNFRYKAEEIIQIDENEKDTPHGQRVAKIFHDADFIVSLDTMEPVQNQVSRFCELIFSSNEISPTKNEYGMFLAKAAALRTIDLSRQVGAAIFSLNGEIISLGANEVPKAGGGTYWTDGKYDDRDFKREQDSNDRRKKEILFELAQYLNTSIDIGEILKDKKVRDSQFMDALEYGRIVHAEMSALSDAARLGKAVKDGILYTTTFPCHMCTKHIIASGISRVVFLEPYPKSLALDLHSDSVQSEGGDRGRYQEFPAVQFEHFYGVSPRRYRELFERGKRKDEEGSFLPYINGTKAPLMDIKYPFYHGLETSVIKISRITEIPIDRSQ
jgi:deoxycytidylate deaminase